MRYLILFLISFSLVAKEKFANNFKIEIRKNGKVEWYTFKETEADAIVWQDKEMVKSDHIGAISSITDQTAAELIRKDKATAKKALGEKLKLYKCENMSDGFIKDLCFERRE